MNEEIGESRSLRAFVRGAWLLLLGQLLVAVVVFGFLAIASARLNSILAETATRQKELSQLRSEQTDLQDRLRTMRDDLRRAREATPIVRDAINAFHAGRYEAAITNYQMALELDAENWYIRDLLSYSQYMAGRTAARDGQPDDAASFFEQAVASVRRVIATQPDYIGGYVELAVYECARDRPDAAVAAYDAAMARTPQAGDEFSGRAGEIPQRCRALHQRLTGQ